MCGEIQNFTGVTMNVSRGRSRFPYCKIEKKKKKSKNLWKKPEELMIKQKYKKAWKQRNLLNGKTLLHSGLS